MTLEEVRNEIDEIDTNMKPLFLRRMQCGKHVAEIKDRTEEMYLFSKENLKSLKKSHGCRSGDSGRI